MAENLTATQQANQPARSEAAPPGARQPKVLEDLLVGLRRAVRDLSFYPEGHPSLRQSLDRLAGQLRQILETENPLSLTIGRDAISHALGPIGKTNTTVKGLAAELFQGQIRRLHFVQHFTPEELKALLGMLGRDPKKLLMEGGPEAVLAAAGVRNIQVNQLRYNPVGGDRSGAGGTGLQSGGEDTVHAMAPAQGEELKEGTAQSGAGAADGLGQVVGGAPHGADLLMQAADDQLIIEEESLSLEELLARLQTAEGLVYSRLARRLEAVARKALETRNVEEFLRFAGIMVRHRDDATRGAEIRLAATQWLEGMAQSGGPDFLAEQLCAKEPDHVEPIMGLLAKMGGPAVEALIARLSLEESMAARRRLIAAIVRTGDVAVPNIVRGLEDERWFVVRNMATILAELGQEDTVQVLGRHLRHPDRRVRRELVRAIAKIGGRHAIRLLRGCLRDEDLLVRQTCVGYLAAVRDAGSLQVLLAIAAEPSREKDAQELRKAAILALGQFGSRAAVPLLVATLRKRSWFRRAEPEEVRAAAATALGMLGGPEAVAALQRVRDRGRLGQVCQEALSRLGA